MIDVDFKMDLESCVLFVQTIEALKAKPGVDAAFPKGTALHTIASRLRTIHEEKVGQLCAEKERLDFEQRLAINGGLVQRGRHPPSCGSRTSKSRSSTKSSSLSSSNGEAILSEGDQMTLP